jgi:hypothetical protein
VGPGVEKPDNVTFKNHTEGLVSERTVINNPTVADKYVYDYSTCTLFIL